jgi:hypothetical protein
MKLAIRTIASLALLVVIIIFGIIYAVKQHKYLPRRNDKPHYFMTVQGYISPKLKNKVALTWTSTYYTTNPACQTTVNPLEGVYAARMKSFTLHIKPSAEGRYHTKYPINALTSGYCHWRLMYISYLANQINRLITFKSSGKTYSAIHDTILCQNDHCVIPGGYYVDEYKNLTRKQNIKYVIDIKRK